ncbi:hypothetical protein D7W79_32990, partial [Corallococcus exercitus]|uniref:hypothetical protein n=1 Tax=Corallococcus exercitus TaxID=2316736 RepID=UPI000ED9A4E4
MTRDDEKEIWLAIDEGLVPREEAGGLLEEARRRRRSPLELLRERGLLSEETLESLLKDSPAPAGPRPGGLPAADETAPLDAPRAVEALALRQASAPAFPIPGWDRYQPV